MKTITTKDAVQVVDGYIPVAHVSDYRLESSLIDPVCNLHGGHKTVGNKCLVLVSDDRQMLGDWIVEYFYDETDGISINRVFIAVKL